jgi:isopenicillin N synthase-like dioxygenase
MLTLLLTDEVPGLQIQERDKESGEPTGVWVPVPPRTETGALIVNIGDMLERWSNGLFRSTVHRVVSSGQRERYSAPFFFEPNFHAKVECLESCKGPGRPAKWAPITSGEHLLRKYAASHASMVSAEA